MFCFSNEGTSASNEENERILPGAVIAENPDHVRFLYTLADIGYAYGNNYLRKSATDVLKYVLPIFFFHTSEAIFCILPVLLIFLARLGKFFSQIPPDTMSVTMLRELVESGRLFDLLPSESSNHVLHLLRVLHSLLLPSNGHFMTEATEFQVCFFFLLGCMCSVSEN